MTTTTIPENQHHLVPRKITVGVQHHDVEVAEQGAAGACAYAAAIYRKFPHLSNVLVTATAVLVSDPTIRWRYTWITPDDVAEWLWGWDHSDDKIRFLKDNPAPKLVLNRAEAQIRHMREKSVDKRMRDRDYNKKLRARKAARTPAEVLADEKQSEKRRRKIRGTS